MPKTERTIIPGSNRHFLSLAREKASHPEPSLQQRVTTLETYKEELGSASELKLRIQHLEESMRTPSNHPEIWL